LIKECLLPIPGYEGRYSVSDLGRVRNDHNGRMLAKDLQRPSPRTLTEGVRTGHLRVQLYDAAGGKRWHRVSRLVLTTFDRPAKPGEMGLHGEGGPQDDRLVNLRWGTLAEMGIVTHCHRRAPAGRGQHQAQEPHIQAPAAGALLQSLHLRPRPAGLPAGPRRRTPAAGQGP